MNPVPPLCPVCGAQASFKALSKKEFSLYTCSACRLVIKTPLPTEKEMEETNRDYYESANPEELLSVARRSLHVKVLRLLEKRLGGKKGKILDVGCGEGHFLKLAADDGWEVGGVEIAPKLRAWAREVYHLDSVREKFESFLNGKPSFNAVLFLDMLDETTRPDPFVKNAFQCLKSNGAVLIRVRNASFQVWLLRLFLTFHFIWRRWTQKAPYVIRPVNFTAKALKTILIRNGFVDVKVRNSPLTAGDPYGIFSTALLARAAKGGIAAAAKAMEWLTLGHWLIGPSLLATGRKP